MKQLKECGSYSVGDQRMEWMRSMFHAGFADDKDTLNEIGERYNQDGYLMDTHTAVASRVLKQYREATGDRTVSVIVSTASPYKFAADVLSGVIGRDATQGLNAFECSEKLEEETGVPMPAQVKQLRELPVRHTARCEKDGMDQAVLDAFG